VHLEQATLINAHLENTYLRQAYLQEANLFGVYLYQANLGEAHLEATRLYAGHLEEAVLRSAHLEGADLQNAHLEQADLTETHLEGACLTKAHLEKADLSGAILAGLSLAEKNSPWGVSLGHNFYAAERAANLQRAVFDSETVLNNVKLGSELIGCVSVADVIWGGVNLAVVEWETVTILGEERTANQKGLAGHRKGWMLRAHKYRTAVRANRQLSITLREQGLYEEAAYYAYSAQVLQRKVYRHQWKWGLTCSPCSLPLFLDMVIGLGVP